MQLEAEHKAPTIALAKKRQALPWRKIDQNYIFDGGPLGHKSLSDLFGEADTLFVYHLMYSTGKDRACPRCTSLLELVQYNFMFDLTPEGRPEGAPEMSFLKHKDAYQFPGRVYQL